MEDFPGSSQPHTNILPNMEIDGEPFPPLLTLDEFEHMMFDNQPEESPQASLPSLTEASQSDQQAQPKEQVQSDDELQPPKRSGRNLMFGVGCPCCWWDDYESDTDTDRQTDLDEPSYAERKAARRKKTPSNAESRFHLFPNLPPEIQRLIWHHAALVTYRKLRRTIKVVQNGAGIKGQCFAVAMKKDYNTMHPFPSVLLASRESNSIASRMFNEVEYVRSGNSAAMGADNPCHRSDMLYVAKIVPNFQQPEGYYPIDDSWIWMWAPGSWSDIKPFPFDFKAVVKGKVEMCREGKYRHKTHSTIYSKEGYSEFLQWKGQDNGKGEWELLKGSWDDIT